MKNIFKFILLIFSLLSLSSCRSNAGIDNNPEPDVTGDSNVLVAYFSYSGNTQSLARTIAETINGDLFRIVVSEPYTKDNLYDRAQNEVNSKSFPEISTHIDKTIFSSYDTVLIGFPIWWYDLPRPVATFVSEYDFTSKTVIPFFTHNGSSNGASSLTTLSSLLNGAIFRQKDALSIRGSNVSDSSDQIKDWAYNLVLDSR